MPVPCPYVLMHWAEQWALRPRPLQWCQKNKTYMDMVLACDTERDQHISKMIDVTWNAKYVPKLKHMICCNHVCSQLANNMNGNVNTHTHMIHRQSMHRSLALRYHITIVSHVCVREFHLAWMGCISFTHTHTYINVQAYWFATNITALYAALFTCGMILSRGVCPWVSVFAMHEL